MRLFYREFFNEFLDNAVDERFTMSDDNQLLGAAETLVVQVRACRVRGTSPTLYLNVWRSNDGSDWTSEVVIGGWSLTEGVTNFSMWTVSSGGSVFRFGGHVKFGVQLGGVTPSAQVQLVVCGRGESRRNFAARFPTVGA